ncbi:Suppressor of G2 allele of SKP1 [Paragonimus heterotremus]|uniref:Suppressor of G2 allele of SKP1 n=1 Tax=Paragonimus heterotremus TaxID=100268 RepID=A0A8J4SJM8_9TREM|nr:Suppressor of G2 allele of SKP1 [Paragonimus heterotremus]
MFYILVILASPVDGISKIAHTYPSSSKVAHDWSKLEKEAAEIEDDGDPLNKLFQNIYADASDETRRAMIKSFTESGGTVLSTNWKEVGKEKVEMKPPDGMEYKKYEI